MLERATASILQAELKIPQGSGLRPNNFSIATPKETAEENTEVLKPLANGSIQWVHYSYNHDLGEIIRAIVHPQWHAKF